MSDKRITLLLIALVVFSSIGLLFHVLRISTVDTLPLYEQYQYLDTVRPLMHNYTLSFMRIAPLLMGLLSIALLYRILLFEEEKTPFILYYVVLSPAFLYAHLTFNDLFLPLFLILFGTHSLLRDRFVISAMSFVSAMMIDAGLFIVILIALSILYEKQKGGIVPFIAMILATVFFIQLSPGSLTAISPTEIVLTKITDFGATRGMGVFGVLLALLGILLSWKDKDRHAILYLGLICLFVASLIRPSLIVFIDLLLAYYAGSALFLLWRSAWESETLKYYVLILVICGLIFSSGSYIRSLSQAPPTFGETKSMQWLSAREGKVLSYYGYGHFIRTLSGNEPYTDPTYYETSRDKTKIQQSQQIFQSRSYENITQFFIRNNITYLWVSPQMTDGLIWQDEDQGMRLIMHNSREFSRPYDYLGVEIWKFSP